MRIDRLELRLLKLPLVDFFETSFGRITEKHFILIRAEGGVRIRIPEGVHES